MFSPYFQKVNYEDIDKILSEIRGKEITKTYKETDGPKAHTIIET